jgi:hypothetical protein
MKYIPNNSLLTEADSLNHHHFNLFIIQYYLLVFILYISNTNHNLTETSSSHNIERSACLNHGFSPLIEVSSSFRYIKAPPSTRLWQLQRFSILDTKSELLPLTRLWHSQLASGRGEGNNSNTAEKVVL